MIFLGNLSLNHTILCWWHVTDLNIIEKRWNRRNEIELVAFFGGVTFHLLLVTCWNSEVAEAVCCKKSLATCCKICLLIVAEVSRCKNSLVTRCKIWSLLVAEVACCKNLFFVKNNSLLVSKFNRYLLHKVTKKSQLNLVIDDKI